MLMSSKPKALERSGLNILYTFTPFKLLKSEHDKYVIQLIELSSFKVYPRTPRWRRGLQEASLTTIRYRDKEIKKRIVMPRELLATTFKPSNGEQYVYLRYSVDMKHIDKVTKAQKHISMLSEDIFKKNLPIYLEFSYQSLQEPYVCRQGYVLLSSSENCPLESVCPRMRLDESGKCKYYIKINNTYAGLYHIFPLVRTLFEIHREEELEDVMIIPYNGMPLIKMSFTEKGEVLAFINAVVFIPKRTWLFYIPRFYLYSQPTIGIRLKNVHAIIFEFNVDHLKNIIIKILSDDDNACKWLILKYVFGRLPLVQRGSHKLVDGFKGFDDLASMFQGIAEGDSESIKKMEDILLEKNKWLSNSDFINYATFVLVHTLAHIMLTAISTIYDIPEETLAYYIEHPILYGRGLHEGDVKLVIFEDAIGGFGYLKNFVNTIKEKKTPLIFRELLSNSLKLLTSDDERMMKAIKMFKNNIDNVINEIPNESIRKAIRERVERIWDFVEKVNIYPHVIVFRRSILSTIELGQLDEYLRNMLEEVFSNAPLCWDSCPHCVILEKGCTYASFDQVFVVSKSLVKNFLNLIVKDLEKPSYSIYFTQVRDYVNELIEKAKREILISTASLSPITLDALSTMLSKKPQLKVKILTYTESIHDRQIVEKLKEILAQHNNFEVRLHDRLHAKGILIDDLILLKGSFNFTMRGLEVNVENIDIVYHPKEIMEFRKGFEKVWKESKHLTRIVNSRYLI
ncbi:MAG: hypothetical protein DRP00_04040 [Candidatus Aenigmatarchaeota archaeon]|nr:MAG: hypothetical protein DRP00_04040 [Candidatus Aenigmarchaeota archaeon]